MTHEPLESWKPLAIVWLMDILLDGFDYFAWVTRNSESHANLFICRTRTSTYFEGRWPRKDGPGNLLSSTRSLIMSMPQAVHRRSLSLAKRCLHAITVLVFRCQLERYLPLFITCSLRLVPIRFWNGCIYMPLGEEERSVGGILNCIAASHASSRSYFSYSFLQQRWQVKMFYDSSLKAQTWLILLGVLGP